MVRIASISAGTLVLIGGAYAAGLSLSPTDCSWIVGLTALTALMALGFGVTAVIRRTGRVAGVTLVAWLIAAALTEQFAWAADVRSVCVGVAWLVPMAIGAVTLLDRSDWLVGIGFWAALIAGTTALTHSAAHTSSGVGLILVWRG